MHDVTDSDFKLIIWGDCCVLEGLPESVTSHRSWQVIQVRTQNAMQPSCWRWSFCSAKVVALTRSVAIKSPFQTAKPHRRRLLLTSRFNIFNNTIRNWPFCSIEDDLAVVAGCALVCGCCIGAFDAGGEDQRAEDDVPASGYRCTLLQPPSSPQHSGEPPLSKQHWAYH